MRTKLHAIYSNGHLRLLEPVAFSENQQVTITVSDEIDELIDHACMRRAANNADDSIPIEEVRELLAGEPGSLSEIVVQNRNE